MRRDTYGSGRNANFLKGAPASKPSVRMRLGFLDETERFLPDKKLVVPESSASHYFGAPVYLRGTNHFTTVKPTGIDHWARIAPHVLQQVQKGLALR